MRLSEVIQKMAVHPTGPAEKALPRAAVSYVGGQLASSLEFRPEPEKKASVLSMDDFSCAPALAGVTAKVGCAIHAVDAVLPAVGVINSGVFAEAEAQSSAGEGHALVMSGCVDAVVTDAGQTPPVVEEEADNGDDVREEQPVAEMAHAAEVARQVGVSVACVPIVEQGSGEDVVGEVGHPSVPFVPEPVMGGREMQESKTDMKAERLEIKEEPVVTRTMPPTSLDDTGRLSMDATNGDMSGNVLSQRMWQELNDVLRVLCEKRTLQDAPVMRIAVDIIRSLVAGDTLVRVLFSRKSSDDITAHLLDVAIMSAKLGIALGLTHEELKNLVICGLLHDVGMLRVPVAIRDKQGKLTGDELLVLKRHPEYAHDILQNSPFSGEIAEVVYQEQEREDGSGYPRGLRGDSIHLYAKIIGLAATYTAMLQPRPQRERKIPFEIVKEIIGLHRKQYLDELIKVLIDEFSVFPVGIKVKLNNGEVARVVQVSRLAPTKPVVEVLLDARGKRLAVEKTYDLCKEQILHVVEASFESA